MTETNPHGGWPPSFTLDSERILNLLTGDAFYSNPSAALREAVLNAIDAGQRRRRIDAELAPKIVVFFDRAERTLTVADNGIGMSRSDVSALFTKVGASAATAETKKESVGEFGIGVISYFMAGDTFSLHTNNGHDEPTSLRFHKDMLAGGGAEQIVPAQTTQGTTLSIQIRDTPTFDLLLSSFPHWCRDVEGLSGHLLPANEQLRQGGSSRAGNAIALQHPKWIERAHLGPVADPVGWDAMTGISNVAVLYRGVFVQAFEIRGVWGIEGSIDVDPKRFKPRLNREAFVDGQFQSEAEAFLRACHPVILEAMAGRLATAVNNGVLDKWTEKRWASLWLSVPRDARYASAVKAWDGVFRTLPAFELAAGNKWEPISLERLNALSGEVFVAPLAEEKSSDLVQAAVRLLRNTGRSVIRGIRRDKSWMRFAPTSYATTADLISGVFSSELPPLVPVGPSADAILAAVGRTAPLFTGPPPVDLVKLGKDSPPALRLHDRLVINTDNPAGAAIVEEALRVNAGPATLIGITARCSYEHLTQVAAAVSEITTRPEILSPIRRRFIQRCLA